MEKTLDATLQAKDNYILLKINGDLVQGKVEQFKEDLAEASILIMGQWEVQKKQLHVLTNFAKENKPYIEKTASFGGSYKVKMAGEIIITLSQRDNIKIFDKEEEAIAWLRE
jgi:hypothetical protein